MKERLVHRGTGFYKNMDIKTFSSVIEQICEEKGIAKEKVLETIELALAAAYKKEYNRRGQNIGIRFDLNTGEIKAFQIKLVVDSSMLKPEGDDEGTKETPAQVRRRGTDSNQSIGGQDSDSEDVEALLYSFSPRTGNND